MKGNLNYTNEKNITMFVSETILPTKQGKFRIRAYRCDSLDMEPLAIIPANFKTDFGDILEPITIRVHDKCMTSEVLGSLKCDCGEQLFNSMSYIQNNGV
jgi:GTP cyclohydrolase II